MDFHAGHAKFTSSKDVLVGDKTLTAKHILIATGTKPIVPDTPGAELGITSDGFFELEDLPKSVVLSTHAYLLDQNCLSVVLTDSQWL